MKVIAKLDKAIMNFLQNNVVRFLSILVGIGYILVIKKIPTNTLIYANNFYIKILVALAIAYLACCEPLYAIILAVLFILSLQELNHRNVSSGPKTDYETQGVVGKEDTYQDQLAKKDFLENKIPNPNGECVCGSGCDGNCTNGACKCGNPSDRNLTQNLVNGYITDGHLRDAQNNMVCGSDPDKPVEVFDKILNAQGLSMPHGHEPSASTASKF
jgi:hypothetical protein